MLTVQGESIFTLEIEKSIFISYIKHVETVIEAKDYIKNIKDKYPDANHHVSAYVVGTGGENGHYSDDGEPSGTAGMPVFDCFRKNNLTNYVCVVVRYFGGIKLGAGGLVRAYSRSASENLKLLPIIPIIDYSTLSLTFDYSFLAIIENNLKNTEIINRVFSSQVELLVKLPTIEVNSLITTLISITSGLIKIRQLENKND